jgi:hypothetical protein
MHVLSQGGNSKIEIAHLDLRVHGRKVGRLASDRTSELLRRALFSCDDDGRRVVMLTHRDLCASRGSLDGTMVFLKARTNCEECAGARAAV